MDSTDVLQFISAALACTISLSKIGIPTVIAIYKSNYLLALVSSCTGAVFGSVLFTYLFAWQGNFVKHKKWTRFAFPIWLYVAVTGVIVYFMISPFYS